MIKIQADLLKDFILEGNSTDSLGSILERV